MSPAPSRTRVLGVIGEPVTAVSYVRFIQPFRHLGDHGFELVTLGRELTLERVSGGYEPSPRLLDGIAMLIFPQMVASPGLPDGSRVDLVRPLCRLARRRGIRIVYSPDDYVGELDPLNPAFEKIRDSIGNLETILDHADAFIVTTDELRRTFAGRGRPIHVLPNAVDPACWRPRPRGDHDPRIGWSGSSSHLDDLLMLLPAVREVQRRTGCELVLHGLTELPLEQQARTIRRERRGYGPAQRERAERFLELHRRLRPLRVRHRPFEPLATFFASLSDLDLEIGLCPLLDTPFNRHKSALKLYEYAMVHSMSVASDVPPYAGEAGVTVENDAQAWTETLERYLRDGRAREAELARQRDDVLARRDIATLRHAWARALRQILGDEATACPEVDAGARLLTR